MHKDFEYKYEFNRLAHWTLEKGYTTQEFDTYPRRVISKNSFTGALNVALKQNQADIDHICQNVFQGFKIILHNPNEVPQMSKKYFHVGPAQHVIAKVKPKITIPEDTLNDYDPKRRVCFLNDERKLEFSRFYTQSNCELECFANFTLKHCGCVKVSMLRNNYTRVCDQTEILCLLDAQMEMEKETFRQSFETELGDEPACNCLPLCSVIIYDHEVTSNTLEAKKLWAAYGFDRRELDGLDLSLLTIHFKEEEFHTEVRSEFFGFADFLANIGGLLGKGLL